MDISYFLRVLDQAIIRDLKRKRGYGCVTFASTGSHQDMDAGTFLISSQSIQASLAEVRPEDLESFPKLRSFGAQVEKNLLQATGGVNTYRGLVFLTLFLLKAWLDFKGPACHTGKGGSDQALVHQIQAFAQPLKEDYDRASDFRSARLRARGIKDIRQVPLAGFASLFSLVRAKPSWSLPQADESGEQKLIADDYLTLKILSQFDDTTTIHRASIKELRKVQTWARKLTEDYQEEGAEALNQYCLDQNLSTGGTADLFICALMIEKLF